MYFLGFVWLVAFRRNFFITFLLGICPLVVLISYLALFVSFQERRVVKPRHLKTHSNDDGNMKKSYNHNGASHTSLKKYNGIAKELREIVSHIIDDYVMNWFYHLNPDKESPFPKAVNTCLLDILEKIVEKDIEHQDVTDFVILRLVPLFTNHFNAYTKSIAKFKNLHKQNDLESQKLFQNFDLSLAVEFNNNYRLHPSISLRSNKLEEDISKYAEIKSKRLLNTLIDPRELEAPLVNILLREILNASIISPLLDKCSDPYTWNSYILTFSETALKERNQVHEVKNILAQEVQEEYSNKLTKIDSVGEQKNTIPETIHDLPLGFSSQQFEEYLKTLNMVQSGYELKVLRFQILQNLLKLRHLKSLSKQEIIYQKRMLLSLNMIKAKLKTIEPGVMDRISSKDHTSSTKSDSVGKTLNEFEFMLKAITLPSVLEDPTCIAYFSEYLNTLTDNHTGSVILSYWIDIEQIKNPLEDPTSESFTSSMTPTDVENIQNICDKYFSNKKRLPKMEQLDESLTKNILLFVEKHQLVNNSIFTLVRKSVLLLQKQAQSALQEKYFDPYKKSKIFLKMISDPLFSNNEYYNWFFEDHSRLDKYTSRHVRKIRDSKSIQKIKSVKVLTTPYLNETLDKVLNDESTVYKTYNSTKSRLREKKNKVKNLSFLFEPEINQDNIFPATQHPHVEIRVTDTDPTPALAESHKISDSSYSSESYSDDNLAISSEESILQSNSDMEDLNEDNTLFKHNHNKYENHKEAIGKLSIEIDHIEKELDLLKHLILKAELTNNKKELRILLRSQRSLNRELENKDLLKQQYTICENAKNLYGKVKIFIRSYFSDDIADDGNEITYYLISVNYMVNGQAKTWDVARRFNEFVQLNSHMKRKYKNLVKHLQTSTIFPKRVHVSLRYHISKTLLHEERKNKLENYLRQLLAIPEVCEDDELKKFLTTTDNMDEPTVGLSTVNDEGPTSTGSSRVDLSSTSTTNKEHVTEIAEGAGHDDFNNLEYSNFENYNYHGRSFIKPISDLFISVFSLSKFNSGWLRGRAVVVVLQQLFGSTTEKYIKESFRRYTREQRIAEALLQFKQSIWPENGVNKNTKKKIDRKHLTKMERAAIRDKSRRMFQSLFVEIFGKIVGGHRSRKASRRIHSMVQNPYMNASLIFEIMDAVLEEFIFN